MAAWDLTPTRNPDTGLPHSFVQMPLDVHLELWTAGPRRLLRQSRYAALLAAMHGRRLYESRDLSRLSPADADAIRRFLTDQRRFEEELLVSLRADPATAPAATPELIARNSQLLWTWDFLSLALCLDWVPSTAHGVPTAAAPVDVQLDAGDRPGQLLVDPWPFTSGVVSVRCEGQRLTGRYESDDALGEAFAKAPWETVEVELAHAR